MEGQATSAPRAPAPRRGFLGSIGGLRRSAPNYSRFVALAKLVLPVVAALLVVAISVSPYLSGGLGEIGKSLARLSQTQIRDLRMVRPRYSGLDKEQHPYTVTADAARENGRDAGQNDPLIALEGPKADMLTREGAWVIVSGNTGLYQSETHLLDLFGHVTMFHDKGFQIETASARVNLDTGLAEGQEKVSGGGPSGTIESEGFRSLDSGDDIVFTGKSKLVMNGAHSDGH